MGVVSAIGPNVTTLKVGQKVNIIHGDAGINTPGTLAQRLLISVENLGDIPRGWSDEQAAGAPLVYITAHLALTQFDDVPKNRRHRARHRRDRRRGRGDRASRESDGSHGDRPVAQRGEVEAGFAMSSIRITRSIRTIRTGRKSLKEQLGKTRVNLAIDSIGGPLFNDVLDTLGANGRVSCVGRLAGPVPNFNTASLFFRGIRIGGLAVHSLNATEARRRWGEVLSLLEKSGAKPLVDSVHNFEDLRGAFRSTRAGTDGEGAGEDPLKRGTGFQTRASWEHGLQTRATKCPSAASISSTGANPRPPSVSLVSAMPASTRVTSARWDRKSCRRCAPSPPGSGCYRSFTSSPRTAARSRAHFGSTKRRDTFPSCSSKVCRRKSSASARCSRMRRTRVGRASRRR